MPDCAHVNRRTLLYFLDCRARSLPSFVRYQLEQYRQAEMRIEVFTFLDAPVIRDELDRLKELGVISKYQISGAFKCSFAVFEHVFGSVVVEARSELGDIYFSNAQCFGPLIPAADIVRARESSSAAVWGITMLSEKTGDFVEPYFMAIRSAVIADRRFEDELEAVRRSGASPALKMNAFSKALCLAFGCDSFVRVADARPIRVFRFVQPFSVNATDFLIRKYGMPFVPIAAFRNRRGDRFQIAGAVVDALRETFPVYSEHLMLDYLRVYAPLSWMKSYPGTMHVLGGPDASRTGGDSSLRVAVKAHLFYLEMLEVAYESLANIPVPFDLLCTTCTDEVRDALTRNARTRLPLLRELKVATVPNRGRDIGPWLTALTDEEDGYDIILKYQTKRRLQQPNVFGEAWMSFVNACVLGSPDSVREIFSMFADDENLGVVIPSYPPPITVTTPSAYIGAPEMMKLFEQCRKRFAPLAPAETAAPVFSAGTVFWYRPKALKALRNARLKVEDFPKEPLAPLTILHAMERVIPYVAQSAGYHYRTVMPYERLSRDYLLLEDRMLSSVPLDDHPPLPGSRPAPVKKDLDPEPGFRALAKATLKAFIKAIRKRSHF